MKQQKILEALTDLEDSFLAEADPAVAKPMVKLRKRIALRWMSIAACVALVLCIGYPVVMRGIVPKPPVYDHAVYNAVDIGSFFGKTLESGSTSPYTKVYTPSAEYLNIAPVPQDSYLNIYEFIPEKEEIDRSEMMQLVDSALVKFADAIHERVPKYEILEERSDKGEITLDMNTIELGDYTVYASQTSFMNFIEIRMRQDAERMILNGLAVEVDQSHTDEQIIADLRDVRETLFSLFGVEFSETEIVRYYSGQSEYGAEYIDVYFYDKSAAPVRVADNFLPGNSIRLSFNNTAKQHDAEQKETILTNVRIQYKKKRYDQQEALQVSTQLRRISLQEAEKLLYNGYVFGNHACPICMSLQKHVDFRNYNYVGFAYLKGHGGKLADKIIPFYVFYKEIGKASNGETIYAKTYVPAIEVNGYEAYFESQKEFHKGS